ncbi:hypothetical protein PUN28_011969 [Cardiocondyla obscurior]|uniref:Uncharacterized protein n=1 Tax=Cardiocondyla obscurior TaxID=286306 RepID=A0AAW2FAN3_9HYME
MRTSSDILQICLQQILEKFQLTNCEQENFLSALTVSATRIAHVRVSGFPRSCRRDCAILLSSIRAR